MENKLILITGPSGVGKTTIAYALLKDMPELKRLVTFTTRKKRPNEKDGIDYHFISNKAFEDRINNGQMFEYDKHYGYWYGNSKEDLDKIWKDEKIAMMVLDLAGVKTVLQSFPKATAIFLIPDTLDNLKKRILQRPMSQIDFDKRWSKANSEMKEAETCNFIIKNTENQVKKTISEVKSLILK